MITMNSGKLQNITPDISITLSVKAFKFLGLQCPVVIFLIISFFV